MLLRFLFIALTVSSSSAFVQEFLAMTHHLQQTPFIPKLEHQDSKQALITGIPLDISLEIGGGNNSNKKSANVFSVNKLRVSLASDPILPCPHTAPMTDQPAFATHISESGSFIDKSGLQQLDIGSSCWQLIWRDQAPAGSCVVGLQIQSQAQRNDAKLEAGPLFVSFPVWKQEKLAEFQTQKAECELAASFHLQERDNELAKMQDTSNFLAKAWHYRNAAAAVEKYQMRPVKSLSAIPSDEDVIKISDSLLLSRLGTVWKKGESKFGIPSNTYLGTAKLKVSQPAASTIIAP